MGHKQINGGLMPGGRLRMEKLAALMTNGRLDVKPLITHRFKLEDVKAAMDVKRDPSQQPLKIILEP